MEGHSNCAPYLAHVQANKQSKINAELRLAGELDIVIARKITGKAINGEKQKDIGVMAAEKIAEDRRPIELEIAQKRENLDVLKTYTEQFSNNDTIPLRELNNGGHIM